MLASRIQGAHAGSSQVTCGSKHVGEVTAQSSVITKTEQKVQDIESYLKFPVFVGGGRVFPYSYVLLFFIFVL